MRSHVYPVCSPNFNKADIDKIEESNPQPYTSTFDWYPVTSSSGLKGALSVNKSDLEVIAVDFVYREGGEIMFDLDAFSVPAVSDFDWGGGSNSTIGAALYNSAALQNKFALTLKKASLGGRLGNGPKAGEVICCGVKSTDSLFKFQGPNLSVFTIESGFVNPFHPAFNSGFLVQEEQVSSPPIWVTFMFTGSRFVLLGSNNWY